MNDDATATSLDHTAVEREPCSRVLERDDPQTCAPLPQQGTFDPSPQPPARRSGPTLCAGLCERSRAPGQTTGARGAISSSSIKNPGTFGRRRR